MAGSTGLPAAAAEGRPKGASLPAGFLSLSAEGERRHATVLRSDLSGYTAMTEALGPERILEIKERIQEAAAEVLTRYGGLLSEFRGDEIVALFGVGASDGDARDAVHAVLDLHERVRQIGRESTVGTELLMHSGVCTGLVVIRPGGRGDGILSITGDAINTAARLAGLAAPNEVLLDSVTRRWVESFFDLEDLPPVTVKGKTGQIVPSRVVGVHPGRAPLEGRMLHGVAGFVDREQELTHLEHCLERARTGRGQVVIISAPPGLGKSRLIHEFVQGVPRDETTVVTGQCAPTAVDTPYHPWIEITSQILRIGAGAGAEERMARILAACTELELDPQRYVPALAHLLTVSHPEYAFPATASSSARGHMLGQAVFGLIRRSARRSPLLLVLEDWHWADRASDQFLRQHLGDLASLPALLVVTFRANPEISWPVLGHLTALSPAPFDRDRIAAMVGSMFGGARASESFAAPLDERTGGNPLFVEEIVRSLKAEGMIGVQNGEVSLNRPMPTLGIPDTVQSVVLRRLDHLEPSQREILRRAAVIGTEFSLSILARIVDPAIDLDETISKLRTLDFVTQVRDEPQPVLAFKHAIMQEVAYETLLLRQRRELHRQVAQAIETTTGGHPEEYCESLAYHYARSDDRDSAVRYLEMAGDRAARSFALDAARNHFAAAVQMLAEIEHDPGRMRRRIEINLKWAAASQFAASEQHIDVLRRALDDAAALGDTHLAANCHYWLGRMHYGLGNPGAAIPEFETVLANAAYFHDDRLLGRAYCVLGRVSLFTAEPDRGIELLDTGIPALKRLGDFVEVAYSISSHACIRAFIGEFAKAEELFAEALQLARETGDRAIEALVLQQLIYGRCLRGDWHGAIEAAANCLGISRRSGLPALVAFAELFQAYARWMLGERDAGYNDIVRAIDGYRKMGHLLAASLCHGWTAEICALHGDVTGAQTHADISLEREQWGDRFGHLPALRALATIAWRIGRPSEVRAVLAKALALGEARRAVPDLGITHLHAAELLADLGEPGAAADHRAAARRIFASAEMPWWLARAAQTGVDVAAPGRPRGQGDDGGKAGGEDERAGRRIG